MASTNRKAFERHRHAVRDAHAKSHGFLKGELVIPELPEHLRQGLFARPATYSVVIRLSSAPGDIHSDTIPAPRGMAIKVIGVAGERLLPEDQGRNQDFLLVNIPTLSFGTIGKYRQLIGLLEKNAQNPAVLQRAMAGVARGVEAAVEAVGVEPGATLRGLARDNDQAHRRCADFQCHEGRRISVHAKPVRAQMAGGRELGLGTRRSAAPRLRREPPRPGNSQCRFQSRALLRVLISILRTISGRNRR
ncbi:hypothetical protein [Sphingomonas sp. OV641]|uniref:hypothetical protein n=1 Tax=Sphingomonas sp. OV641 TaxID=1881068 RepID=UPI00210A1337|nr:hypothetical protein [Sphingomonas sp. OV641]